MTTTEKTEVYYVGQLTDVYGCIEQNTRKKFLTTDVIVTSVNIAHMNEKHDNVYAQYGHLFRGAIESPDSILIAEQGRYYVVKQFFLDDGKEKYLTLLLQPKKEDDPVNYCNKVVTAYVRGRKKFRQLARNTPILYIQERMAGILT